MYARRTRAPTRGANARPLLFCPAYAFKLNEIEFI